MPREGERLLPDQGRSGALAELLAQAARTTPDRIAFRDQPGRAAWSGRPSFEFGCAVACEAVRRLSAFLTRLGLSPGASVGILLPNGSEACLTILAVADAGLTPCLLDIAMDAAELSVAMETADLRGMITQTILGPDRPAEKLCFIAAGFFRLRFLMAFGPDVPDGVTDLDRVLREHDAFDARPAVTGEQAASPGIITLARSAAGPAPVQRAHASVLAATASIIKSAKLRAGDRIVSYLPPDDLKGITTGLAAALLTGCTLEPHGVFESSTLADTLPGAGRTHLVAPGWIEAALIADGIGAALSSTILVHDAPTSFTARSASQHHTVDVVCFDEMALIAGARGRPGQFGIDLEDQVREGETSGLLGLRIRDSGDICLRGPACSLHFDAGRAGSDGFAPSGFRVDMVGSEIVGVSRSEREPSSWI